MGQISEAKALLLEPWIDALAYGFFLCVFYFTMHVTFFTRAKSTHHSKVMVAFSCATFVIGTIHVGINCYRLITAYIDNISTPDGPTNYLNAITWQRMIKDGLFLVADVVGNSAAIYRCWVLWNKRWVVVALPILVFIFELVAIGFAFKYLALLRQEPTADQSVFEHNVFTWLSTVFVSAVCKNIMTTGLMAYKVWITTSRTAAFTLRRADASFAIFRIIIESAALQLVAEIIVLGLYVSKSNAFRIMLSMYPSIVGVTFNAITIRIRVRTLERPMPPIWSDPEHVPVRTIGSMPMHRINISVDRDVEDNTDSEELRKTQTGLDSREQFR